MSVILNIGIFLFGLAVGSFLNCVIYRMEQKKSFLKGRSYCPNCKHVLSWKDLIPVLSFIILKGKCRYCNKRISIQYPILELATALLFLVIFWILGFRFDLTFGFWILISSLLIIIFVFDLKHYIIPDSAIFPAIILTFLYNLITNYELLITNYLFSALAAAGFFLIIYLVSRGKWLGFGDVKLTFLMGFFLGFPNILVALFLSYLVGAIIGIGLIIAKKKSLKSKVPFGPFLVTGTFIALFFGERIINWYLNLIT